MILVTMPFKGDFERLRESVKSILRQSYEDYMVLVINDGGQLPAERLGINHPRLKYFNLPENKGRYFCDAVALQANPYEFFLPHDSDDISLFNRLYYLAREQKKLDADAVFHCQKLVMRSGKVAREAYPLLQRPLYPQMKHLAHWSGLYKTQALKDVGGIHPDYRVAYDTLLVNLLRINEAKIGFIPRYLYTRYATNHSLTTSIETGFGSPHRSAATIKLINLYHRSMSSPEHLKEIIQSSIKPETIKEVEKQTKRLKDEMRW